MAKTGRIVENVFWDGIDENGKRVRGHFTREVPPDQAECRAIHGEPPKQTLRLTRQHEAVYRVSGHDAYGEPVTEPSSSHPVPG